MHVRLCSVVICAFRSSQYPRQIKLPLNQSLSLNLLLGVCPFLSLASDLLRAAIGLQHKPSRFDRFDALTARARQSILIHFVANDLYFAGDVSFRLSWNIKAGLPPFTSEVPMTAATESSHCPRTFEKVRSTP